MNLVQITAGAGGMFCGICFRDNAVVAALRKMGHDVLMVPLYLPLTLDEEDQSAGVPIFFSGINVYLEQKSALFRHAPNWLHQMLTARGLLSWVGTKAAKTQPRDLGDLTLSMLRGEEGNQARDLYDLIEWLRTHAKPDAIMLSNALLIGLARQLKAELNVPVICMFQGEDGYLDSLPEAYRADCWKVLAERAGELDGLCAPSGYFAEFMTRRLSLPTGRVKMVPNGINLTGYAGHQPAIAAPNPPVLGYFARMCHDKGLDVLIDAYLLLRKRARVKNARLKIGGGCGPTDEVFVAPLRRRLEEAGVGGDVEFHPNLDRAGKIDFLRSLSVFSVPSRSREAFGLYVVEAMAAGVPVVQPRAGAFPEIVEATGGGALCEPENREALADCIEKLLLEPERARKMGALAREAVLEKFSAEAMARGTLEFCQTVVTDRSIKAQHSTLREASSLQPSRSATSLR
jgi:glycosyltransferase involved in cell wall biosynthesis